MKYIKFFTMTLLFAQFSSYGAGPAASAATPPASAADAAAGSPALAGAGAPTAPLGPFTDEAIEAMWKALIDGNLEETEDILSSGRANPNVIDHYSGETPLTRLLKMGWDNEKNFLSTYPAIITTLLNYGANPNLKDSSGQTPLHAATQLRPQHVDAVIKNLIAHKGDINKHDDEGNTPIILAAIGHRIEIARCLLAHGADPSIANSIYGGDAVFWAQESGVSRLHNHPLGKILPLLHEHKAKTKAAAAAGLAAASPAICAASAAVAGPLTPLRIPTPAMKESNRKSLLITATRALPALGLAAAAAAGLHTLASSPPTLQLMLGTGPHMAAAARPG